jgi:uncharacterized protein (DUF427 family)
VARIARISRQAICRTPRRHAPQRRPASGSVERVIVEEALAHPTDGYRMVTAWARRRLRRRSTASACCARSVAGARTRARGKTTDGRATNPWTTAACPKIGALMGLSWQQGPLGRNPNGQFLVPAMPARVLYAEPLRRRLRAELGGRTVVQSDHAVLLFEPGRYPVAYFPLADFADGALRPTEHRREHRDLGDTVWFEVIGGTRHAARGAWQHVALPPYAAMLNDKVALAWRAMDGFYEEDDRILRPCRRPLPPHRRPSHLAPYRRPRG